MVPERKALADLEFKNRDMDPISDAELPEDRICSLEMRLMLYRLEVPRRCRSELISVSLHLMSQPMQAYSILNLSKAKLGLNAQYVSVGQACILAQTVTAIPRNMRCRGTLERIS